MVHSFGNCSFFPIPIVKKIITSLLFFAAGFAWAQNDSQATLHPKDREWHKAFDIIWESRWHQSGYLMPAVRWPMEQKSIRYSINTGASSGNARRARQALRKITDLIGWEAVEVPDGSSDVQIQFMIRNYTDQELNISICHARGERKGSVYVKQVVEMDEQHVYECVLHELMHAFGFPGHPQGNTVLSYFEGNQLSLKSIDEFLLKTWYSENLSEQATPLQTVQELARLWVKGNVSADQQDAALGSLQRWQAMTFGELERFANGKGQPPRILYRSGRLTTEGLQWGRSYLQEILGIDYLEGRVFGRDVNKAFHLLMESAKNDNGTALMAVVREAGNDTWQSWQLQILCDWMINSTTGLMAQVKSKDKDGLLKQMCARSGGS